MKSALDENTNNNYASVDKNTNLKKGTKSLTPKKRNRIYSSDYGEEKESDIHDFCRFTVN